MKYKVIYDIDTAEVYSVEEIHTDILEVEDDAVAKAWLNGECRARVIKGILTENTEEVRIEENVVPSEAVAAALGLEPNVGIPKEQLEKLIIENNLNV